MHHWKPVAVAVAVATVSGANLIHAETSYAWRYYRTGNTGIQGDVNEAVWIASDGDPYIGGYLPAWEEGGFAKFVQAEDRWINFSNVDYPIIGHPETVGTTRVTDFVPEVGDGSTGKVWIATWRGALRFDPSIGASSLERFGPSNSQLVDDVILDADRAPDGTIWFVNQGIVRYDPATDEWMRWNFGNMAIAIQPKPQGGYLVVSSAVAPFQDFTFTFDSDTQQWTTATYVPSGPAGQLVGLPGKDSVDDTGNLWALRTTTPGGWNSVDYRRPDGAWVTPPEPYASFSFGIWAFKAYGDGRALAADASSAVYQFNGSSWINLGVWRPGAYTYSLDIDAAGNVWVCGLGGAAKRDVNTGQWQRYRVTNTGNCDNFNGDLTIDPDHGFMYTTANAGPGVGGMTRFDGERWISWNSETHGLGYEWPFLNDNCQAVTYRPSTGSVAVSPADCLYGIHDWTGSDFVALPPLDGAKRMVEDSLGRLWAVGSFFGLSYHNGSSWTGVPLVSNGTTIRRDPTLAATIWATNDIEIVRTDGVHTFTRSIGDFPGSAAWFTGLAIEPTGEAWIGTWSQFTSTGSTLIRVDPSDGSSTIFSHDTGWPFPGEHVRPVAVTPDGRLWLHYDSEYPSDEAGLCWYDGVNVGAFPAPPGGQPQWGGMPHAGIADVEVKLIPGGYELWMSCPSRGIAVLAVQTQSILGDLDGDGAVGAADLGILLSVWGTDDPAADFNGDGQVNGADLAQLLASWNG